MTDASEWQGRVGRSWASEWKRTDRSFGGLTARLLEEIGERPARNVLDVGCGAGELSLAIARSRPASHVTGVDISSDLIDIARQRGAQLPNVQFLLDDAATWRPERDGRPELVVSRHGVMFFPDPVEAFANLAAAADDDAQLVFSCFRSRRDNPFFIEISRLLPDAQPPADPHAPGPFAFADDMRVTEILRSAGWTDIDCDRFDFAMIAGGGEDPVEDALEYFATIGPAAAAAREMDMAPRERFYDRVRHMAADNERDGIVSLRASTWIVTARKA